MSLSFSPRIACYGTAFLADDPVEIQALERGTAPDVLQFSSPRLDASFLAKCGSLLTGKMAAVDNVRAYCKRLTGTHFHSAKATHFYECSTEFCAVLAALTEERAAKISREWHGVSGAPKTNPVEPNGRVRRRLSILNNLAALARQAKLGQKKVILRVEYRKQR